MKTYRYTRFNSTRAYKVFEAKHLVMGVQKGKWPEMSICTQDMQGRSWHLYFNEDEARKVYQALHQVFGN